MRNKIIFPYCIIALSYKCLDARNGATYDQTYVLVSYCCIKRNNLAVGSTYYGCHSVLRTSALRTG